MVDAEKRVWADKWAARLKRDPQKFFNQIDKIDLVKEPAEEIAKALDIKPKEASYLKRGFKRQGTSYRGRNAQTNASLGVPLPVAMRMHRTYQKLLQREAELETELTQVRKDLEKYRPIAHAAKSMDEAFKKVKEELETASSN